MNRTNRFVSLPRRILASVKKGRPMTLFTLFHLHSYERKRVVDRKYLLKIKHVASLRLSSPVLADDIMSSEKLSPKSNI